MSNLVVLVDPQDRDTGVCDKLSAHRAGMLHRAISIFIRHHDLILLQKRNPAKYHSGGLWANACCSHPLPGELPMIGAQRRLVEELGFCVNLEFKGSFIYKADVGNGLIEHELDHVFCGNYNYEKMHLNQDEVVEVKWVPLKDLRQDLKDNPQDYTCWLPMALEVAFGQESSIASEGSMPEIRAANG